tara:strand:+ start:138 stop:578 length:441 start_codon:yes stop_codon:yes gene_type:complete
MKEIFGMISIIFILVLLCVLAIWFVGQIFLEIDLSVRKVPVLPFNKKRPWKWQKNKNLNIKNEKEWITYLEELKIEEQIWKAKKDKEERKNIKLREKDPSLNTNDWEQHRRRLFKFNESQFKGTYYYVGPQGGVYYISERGRKVYC